MRRWLAVLLLVLLPLQFSWAAVADYCMHESGETADHVGHHDHKSHAHGAAQADADAKTKTDAGSSSTATVDCSHCHGGCAVTLDLPAGLVPHAVEQAPPTLGDAPCAEHMPAQPERPQWARLA
jgi:hypothetical protein